MRLFGTMVGGELTLIYWYRFIRRSGASRRAAFIRASVRTVQARNQRRF